MQRFTTLSRKRFSGLSKVTAIFLFLICFNRIHGQTHSFSGSIGKYPIYLQMTIDGSNVSGYYFYKNKLIDLSLSGTYKSGVITLSASDENGEAIPEPETFKFKWPNKSIVGTWSQKEKSLPLKLAPVTAKETGSPKCQNPYWLKSNSVENDLTKVKLGLFRLKEVDSIRTINHIKIRYFEEINSKITMFRIDSGLVVNKQKEANYYLEFLQIQDFLESLSCASYSSYGADYNSNIFDLNLSSDFMCFSVFTSYYCGGAHPDEYNYGVNYNLNTREKINLTDFIISGKESAYEDRIYNYLARVNPGYFDENNESEVYDTYTDCEYFRKELWTVDCGFVFTSDGLKLLPSFAHYAATCLDPEWAVIPYSELKDLIKPEYYSKLTKLKN